MINAVPENLTLTVYGFALNGSETDPISFANLTNAPDQPFPDESLTDQSFPDKPFSDQSLNKSCVTFFLQNILN